MYHPCDYRLDTLYDVHYCHIVSKSILRSPSIVSRLSVVILRSTKSTPGFEGSYSFVEEFESQHVEHGFKLAVVARATAVANHGDVNCSCAAQSWSCFERHLTYRWSLLSGFRNFYNQHCGSNLPQGVRSKYLWQHMVQVMLYWCNSLAV